MSGMGNWMLSVVFQSFNDEAALCLGELLEGGYESSSSSEKNGSGLCERDP
jgi:hypothetical protein